MPTRHLKLVKGISKQEVVEDKIEVASTKDGLLQDDGDVQTPPNENISVPPQDRKETLTTKSSENRRNAHNFELIERMKNGESLIAFDNQSSWFPPRPTIKKDKKEIERLYQKKDSDI